MIGSAAFAARMSRRSALAVAAALAIAAPAAQASWTVAPGTVPPNTSAIAGVTCTTASSCLLVGFQSGVASSTLAALWNGTSFSGLAPASTTSELYDTTCGPTLCFAVGADYASGTVPHAESWNGSSFTTTSTPVPTGSTFAALLGVACPSSTACYAVGSYDNGSTNLPLIEAWNGTSWSLQTPTLPANTTAAKLSDVSCVSSSACWAVGYVEVSGQPRRTLVLTWNGTSWSTQTSANPSGANLAQLHGIECTSSSACEAVGQYLDGSSVQHALAEGWNGSTWSLQTVPDPVSGTDPVLQDVSCSSSSTCEGVGQYTSTTPSTEPMAAGWNGSTWSLQAVPKDAGVSDAFLIGVSCPSSCMAVGISIYDGSTGITGQRPAVSLGP
jgi:hypothetical protein